MHDLHGVTSFTRKLALGRTIRVKLARRTVIAACPVAAMIAVDFGRGHDHATDAFFLAQPCFDGARSERVS